MVNLTIIHSQNERNFFYSLPYAYHFIIWKKRNLSIFYTAFERWKQILYKEIFSSSKLIINGFISSHMALEDEIFYLFCLFSAFFSSSLHYLTIAILVYLYYEWIKMNELRFLDAIRRNFIIIRFYINKCDDGIKEMANWSYNASLMLELSILTFPFIPTSPNWIFF